jgi:hypothetical protein
MHMEISEEFQREIGVKLSAKLLQTISQAVISQSTHVHFGGGVNVPGEEKSVMSRITNRRVPTFMDRDDIVQRKQAGMLMAYPEKEEFMERQEATASASSSETSSQASLTSVNV